eukprot:Em0012g494a
MGEDCQNISVEDSVLYVALNATFSVFGILCCVATIVLILSLKIYRQHIHRLQLYIAVFCSLFNAALAAEVIPVYTSGSCVRVRPGWNSTCVALGFISQYFGFAKSFSMLWICWYVFMLAICNCRIKREVTGIVVILILPCFFAWIPFIHNSYGLNGVWCWIKYDESSLHSFYEGTLQSSLIAGVDLIVHLMSTVMILIVSIVFCRGAYTHNSILKHQHMWALKEVLPLLVYPAVDCIGVILVAAKTFYFIATQNKLSKNSSLIQMVSIAAIQVSTTLLPLSLLLHPSVRSLACRRKQKVSKMFDDSENHSIISTEYSNSSNVHPKQSLLSGARIK